MIDNIATVDASNDDPDSNGATVTVQCPDVSVAKTPDNGTVNAGGNAVFTIVVSNAGPGGRDQRRRARRPAPGGLHLDRSAAPTAPPARSTPAPNPDVLSCDLRHRSRPVPAGRSP